MESHLAYLIPIKINIILSPQEICELSRILKDQILAEKLASQRTVFYTARYNLTYLCT